MTESANTGARASNRDGFALPMAILIIVLLTMGVAAGLAATTTETRTNSAALGNTKAMALAESALERYVAGRGEVCKLSGASCSSDPISITGTGYDSIRVSMTGGYADVVSTRIRDTSSTNTVSLFFVRSHGVYTRRVGSSADSAEHTVGLYAKMNSKSINVTSSIVSYSGINKSGSSGTVSGIDNCGGKDTLAGITAPKGDFSSSGNTSWAKGSPPIDTTQTLATMTANAGIDWNSVRNGGIPYDFTVSSVAGWTAVQAYLTANPTAYPSIHVTMSSFSLPSVGRGLLVVDGDFTISGSNMWDGVILVGGALTSNGNNTMTGATISGLNVLLGQSVGSSNISDTQLNGSKIYLYDSCSVAKATSGLRDFIPMMNTWTDNVTSW